MDVSTIGTRGSRLLAAVLGCLLAATASAGEFQYSGDAGPAFWGDLDPAWEACAGKADGARQSPIDIRRARKDATLKPLELHVPPMEIDLINTGHVIEQEYQDGGTLVFADRLYDLLQFHFHTLSEHTVRGRRGVLELHAVFREAATGHLTVVGRIYHIGRSDRFLGALISAGLPRRRGDASHSSRTIDLAWALRRTDAYYTYPGSLTTPPCAEIVNWVVLKSPGSLSPRQFRAFREVLGNDFRPLQPRNGRVIRGTVDRSESGAADGS